MDLEAMRILVREALSFTEDEDTRIDAHVNEACRDFRRDAQSKVERFADVQLTEGQSVYPLDDFVANGILRLLSVTATGAGVGERPVPLDVVDMAEFDALGLYVGTPQRPVRIALLGLDQVALWPTPGGEVYLHGWAVPRPDELTQDTHVPDEPEEYHRTIVYRAIQLGLEFDRQSWDEVQAFEQRYLQGVGSALSARKRMLGSSPKSLRPAPGYVSGTEHSFRREVGLD